MFPPRSPLRHPRTGVAIQYLNNIGPPGDLSGYSVTNPVRLVSVVRRLPGVGPVPVPLGHATVVVFVLRLPFGDAIVVPSYSSLFAVLRRTDVVPPVLVVVSRCVPILLVAVPSVACVCSVVVLLERINSSERMRTRRLRVDYCWYCPPPP